MLNPISNSSYPPFQTTELQPLVEPDPLQLLTADEAAAILKLGLSTVTKMARCGELRCVRFGRSVRFRRGDLEAIINNHLK